MKHNFFAYSYANMYFNFKNFLQMSLFIKQANLCFRTTKTTEMLEINIILLISRYLKKKIYQPKYRLF